MEARLGDLKQFVEDGVRKLSKLLRENAPLAKHELHRHLLVVQMYPYEDGEGSCYIAQGSWDLLGIDPNDLRSRMPEVGRFEMVAGSGSVPQSLIDSVQLADSTMVRNARKGHKGKFFIQFSFSFPGFVILDGTPD